MFTLCTNFIVSFQDRFIFQIKAYYYFVIVRIWKYNFSFCYEFYDSNFQTNAKNESNQIFPVEWTRNQNTIIHSLNVVNGRNAMNILIFRSIANSKYMNIFQGNYICANWRTEDWSGFQLFPFSVHRKVRKSPNSLVLVVEGECFRSTRLKW